MGMPAPLDSSKGGWCPELSGTSAARAAPVGDDDNRPTRELTRSAACIDARASCPPSPLVRDRRRRVAAHGDARLLVIRGAS